MRLDGKLVYTVVPAAIADDFKVHLFGPYGDGGEAEDYSSVAAVRQFHVFRSSKSRDSDGFNPAEVLEGLFFDLGEAEVCAEDLYNEGGYHISIQQGYVLLCEGNEDSTLFDTYLASKGI